MLSQRATTYITPLRPLRHCSAAGCIAAAALATGTGLETAVLPFCPSVLCGAPRYVLIRCGYAMEYTALKDNEEVSVVSEGAASWIDFVRTASIMAILNALCAVPVDVVRSVDDVCRVAMTDLVTRIADLQQERRQGQCDDAMIVHHQLHTAKYGPVDSREDRETVLP